MPGLAFGKVARAMVAAKDGAAVAKAGETAAKRWRPQKAWNDCDLVPPGGLRLTYGANWTPAQRKAADDKIKAMWEAAQQGELKKTVAHRDSASAAARFKNAGGTVPVGHDVDHIIDLQLGGADELSNMKPLDRSVNRSIGTQFERQLRQLVVGATVVGLAICAPTGGS